MAGYLGTLKVGKYTKIYHQPEVQEGSIFVEQFFALERTSPDGSCTFFESYNTLRKALLVSRELKWK